MLPRARGLHAAADQCLQRSARPTGGNETDTEKTSKEQRKRTGTRTNQHQSYNMVRPRANGCRTATLAGRPATTAARPASARPLGGRRRPALRGIRRCLQQRLVRVGGVATSLTATRGRAATANKVVGRRAARSTKYRVSANVNPFVLAKQMATTSASAGANYPRAAPTSDATGSTKTPTTVDNFLSTGTGLQGNALIMPALMSYGSDYFPTENCPWTSGQTLVLAHATTPECLIEPHPQSQGPKLATATGGEGYEGLRLQMRPLHLPNRAMDDRALLDLRHSLCGGQRRRIKYVVSATSPTPTTRIHAGCGKDTITLTSPQTVGPTYWGLRPTAVHAMTPTTCWSRRLQALHPPPLQKLPTAMLGVCALPKDINHGAACPALPRKWRGSEECLALGCKLYGINDARSSVL